ncbi:hypothetical protein SAMN05660489_02464 [Pseudomonas sp. LAMO17WK12:I10]|nr:hypothetical protein H160_02549 [Pseudomonas sp. LAMO17WK12:I9]SNY29474.1 hypothetical protein SAMN05660489_02464 [Pseudomonas sp. LAMO17WK12:I10]
MAILCFCQMTGQGRGRGLPGPDRSADIVLKSLQRKPTLLSSYPGPEVSRPQSL